MAKWEVLRPTKGAATDWAMEERRDLKLDPLSLVFFRDLPPLELPTSSLCTGVRLSIGVGAGEVGRGEGAREKLPPLLPPLSPGTPSLKFWAARGRPLALLTCGLAVAAAASPPLADCSCWVVGETAGGALLPPILLELLRTPVPARPHREGSPTTDSAPPTATAPPPPPPPPLVPPAPPPSTAAAAPAPAPAVRGEGGSWKGWNMSRGTPAAATEAGLPKGLAEGGVLEGEVCRVVCGTVASVGAVAAGAGTSGSW